MTARDNFGWPVRLREDGARICARTCCARGSGGKASEEFRIDGYCSHECEDMHELELLISELELALLNVTRERDELRAGMPEFAKDLSSSLLLDEAVKIEMETLRTRLSDLEAAVRGNDDERICQLVGHEPVPDNCGRPAHDYCARCHAATPGAAHKP